MRKTLSDLSTLTKDERAHRRRIVRIFCNNRWKSKKFSIPFDLEFCDLPPIPEKCPVLGIPITFSNKTNDPNSPSLDRRIPSLGYVKGNVAWISFRANMLKRDATNEEINLLARWMNK